MVLTSRSRATRYRPCGHHRPHGTCHLAHLLALALLGCGGDPPVYVDLVVDGAALAGVKQVRLTAGRVVRQVAYAPGTRLELPAVQLTDSLTLLVEGLDDDAIVIARGESAAFSLARTTPERIAVPFARCPLIAFEDHDGDGYGNDQMRKTLCAAQLGFVETGGDCDDQDRRARPGQTEAFDHPSAGANTYDYNCDGTTTRSYPRAVNCAELGPSQCNADNETASGWSELVPDCGGQASFVRCAKLGPRCGVETRELRSQTCL